MIEIKVAVVDDEKVALSTVSGAIRHSFMDFGITPVIKEYDKLATVYFEMEDNSYDLLILDIDMGDKINGVEFAKRLRNEKISSDILFVSNCEDKAFDAFEVKPLGFIRKKNFINDLKRYIPTIVSSLKERKQPRVLLLNKGKNEVVQVDINDIVYVEGNFKQQIFYTKDPDVYYIVRRTMKHIEEELSNSGFIRTHGSYIVNSKYVKGLLNNYLIVEPNIKIPIARAKLNQVKKEYLALMKEKDALI